MEDGFLVAEQLCDAIFPLQQSARTPKSRSDLLAGRVWGQGRGHIGGGPSNSRDQGLVPIL